MLEKRNCASAAKVCRDGMNESMPQSHGLSKLRITLWVSTQDTMQGLAPKPARVPSDILIDKDSFVWQEIARMLQVEACTKPCKTDRDQGRAI
jgi:hypothetical protein